MGKVRTRRIGEEIQHHLAEIIDRKLKDPRKGFITLTGVRVSPDLSLATVNFTAVDKQGEQATTEAAALLERAAGFLRHELAASMKLRVVPQLRFFYDDSMDKRDNIESIFRSLREDAE
jgi:ribosome-binding factor A